MSLKDAIVFISSTLNNIYIGSSYIIQETFFKLNKYRKYRILQLLIINLKLAATETNNSKNKINEKFFYKDLEFFSFLEQHYSGISDLNKDLNEFSKKRYNPIDMDKIPIVEMEVENGLLNHLCRHLKGKDFDYMPDACSLFLFKNHSYLHELLSSPKIVIFTDNSEMEHDKVKLADIEFEKSNKGVKIESRETKIKFSTECPKDWNAKILVPEHYLCKTDEPDGSLSNIKLARSGFFKDILIDQFSNAIVFKFLGAASYVNKRYSEKIFNLKETLDNPYSEILISRQFSQILKSDNEHVEKSLENAESSYEKTLILSKFTRDYFDKW